MDVVFGVFSKEFMLYVWINECVDGRGGVDCIVPLQNTDIQITER